MHPDKDLQLIYITEVTKKDILSGFDHILNAKNNNIARDYKEFVNFVKPYTPNYTTDQLKDLYKYFDNTVRPFYGFEPFQPSETYQENYFGKNEASIDILMQVILIALEQKKESMQGELTSEMEEEVKKSIVNEIIQAFNSQHS